MAWSGFHITKSGRDLLNRCLTTGAFRFVKVVLGDGAYTGSWDDYAPVSPKMTFEGEDMRVYRSGDSTRVEISLTSDGNTTGWYYREYALFATDGSDTVVFACDTCGGDGEYIDHPGFTGRHEPECLGGCRSRLRSCCVEAETLEGIR